jgi:MYXO-CTERM domain-containing protein
LKAVLSPQGVQWARDATALHSARASGLQVSLPVHADGPISIAPDQTDQLRILLTPERAGTAEAKELEGRIVYAGAYTSTDVIRVADPGRFEELLLLRDSSAPTDFSWKIALPPAILRVDDSSDELTFFSKDGAVFRVPPALAWDARGVRRHADLQWDGEALRVHLDAGGLASPVLLDPIVESFVWQDVTPGSASPAARINYGMAFDKNRGVAVLVGGTDVNGALLPIDTWEWGGAAWSPRCSAATTSCGISNRDSFGLAYDTARHVTVLFGGEDAASALSQTVEWNGTAPWAARCAGCVDGNTRPPPRTLPGMAYDELNAKTVMFGGQGATALGDTWLWSGATDTWTQACTGANPCSSQPSARVAPAMAYEGGGKILLFGGGNGALNSETWEWDGAAPPHWTQVCIACIEGTSAPTRRNGSQMAYDSIRNRVVLFGGQGNGVAHLADTWEWNPTTQTWSKVAPSGAPTGGRQFSAMAFDSAHGRALLFSGDNGVKPAPQDTWAYHSRGGGNPSGTACTVASQCDTGFCTDGVCCETACNLTCQRCDDNTSGNIPGVCSSVKGAQDADTCTGNNICSATGTCGLKDGQSSCTTGTQCASGNCVDGTCCVDTCLGECLSCANAAGTCTTFVAADVQDTNSTTKCNGANACDGAGNCLFGPGVGCGVATQCASGFCVDNFCSANSCTTPCKSNNNAGTCAVNVPLNQPDSNSVPPCTGTTVCNGNGACLSAQGQTCTLGTQCASGNCADGHCCNTACNGVCQTCANSAGTCMSIPDGQTDNSPACNGANVCAGGVCLLAQGQTCTGGGQCASGFCADGHCCDGACGGTCQTCNNAAGTCLNIASGLTDNAPACSGASACDGNGGCKSLTGQTCAQTNGSTCLSGNCADGHCCATACNGPCQTCNNTSGTCGNIAYPGTDNSPACTAPNACDGSGNCKKANSGGCTTAADCASGFCSGGYCCNVACDGACDSCASGTCALDTGAPGAPSCSPFQCNGSGKNCPTTCATAADCAPAFFCLSGSCVPDKMQGDKCTDNSQCPNNVNCVDGVCCDAACSGSCVACTAALKGFGQDGKCEAIADGQLPRTAGACDSTQTCVKDGKCNGAGICRPNALSNEPCSATAATVCAANAVSGKLCDGNGSCSNTTGSTPCDPFTCDANSIACRTSCASDGDCVMGAYCVNNLCQPKHSLSTSCGTANECTSGYCADGVCCDRACDGACDACGSDGACQTSTVGTAGNPVCDPYVCDGTSSQCPQGCTTDMQCIGTDQCLNGACVARMGGSTCTLDEQCPLGHCADGVCCDSVCDGQCEQCNAKGTEGQCLPVTGDPAAGHAACAGTDASCRGACDGTNRTACTAQKASGDQCQSPSCSLNTQHVFACDDAGKCNDTPKTCGDYVCDDTTQACKTSCQTKDDCALQSLQCVASSCQAANSACSQDNTSLVDMSGKSTSCAPFLCRGSACLSACTASTDCATGNVCDAASGKCSSLAALDAPASSDKGGCSCRVAGGGESKHESRSALLGLGALVLASFGRRRRRLAAAS